jgi:ADP-heptose:LPS heptosyltransferase
MFKAFMPLVQNIRFLPYDSQSIDFEERAQEVFDFVHSYNVLQRLADPVAALRFWISLCRRNGHLVITVPDEDRYEQGVFPSTFSDDHRWSFTISKSSSWSVHSINVMDLLKNFREEIEIIKIELIDTGFEYRAERVDQTLHGMAESSIEFVLRKLDCNISNIPYKRILIRRWWAMGDVIMVTPIIARLRAEMGDDIEIDIITGCPDVFEGDKKIRTNPPVINYYDYCRVIDLDGVYERNRTVHAVDAYMLACWGDAIWPNKQTTLLHQRPTEKIAVDWRSAVVIHAGATQQRNRMMPRAFWDRLIQLLLHNGLIPVIVGGGQDHSWPGVAGVVDLTNRHSLAETAWVIDQCACFVSCDTGVMHVAGTTNTPIVAIFTSVLPEHRMRWRDGILGWLTTPLVPALDCIGCNGGDHCRRGDFACVEGREAIQPEEVLAAVQKIIPVRLAVG